MTERFTVKQLDTVAHIRFTRSLPTSLARDLRTIPGVVWASCHNSILVVTRNGSFSWDRLITQVVQVVARHTGATTFEQCASLPGSQGGANA